MRFLVIHGDYPDFTDWLYTNNKGLENKPYQEQIRARHESLFYLANFYSQALIELGHEAYDVYVTNEIAQRTWAREHDIHVSPSKRLKFRLRKGFFPWLFTAQDMTWMYQVLEAQIKEIKPDIIFNPFLYLDTNFFRKIKPLINFLIGQHCEVLPGDTDFEMYDLMISTLPSMVSHFKAKSVNSELQYLAFEPKVLDKLHKLDKQIPISFVGSVSDEHSSRKEWLEYICQHIPIEIWGKVSGELPSDSPIGRNHKGPAWGLHMYEIFHNSKITLNHHIDMAGPFAGSARLYETTGAGTLLITDWKENLHKMFKPGKEVVTYRNPEECVELINHYLDNEEERKKIAAAGQERTLKDHTYRKRIEKLLSLIQIYL